MRGARVLLLALAATTAIAIGDVFAGSSTVLIGVLVAGPLIAATASGARRTAAVWVYALALSVWLGVPDHFFGTTDHLFRVLTVIVGGGLATWIAALRERRERDSLHLGVQYSVARALSEADSLEAATPELLETIGRSLGFEAGALWRVAEGDTLCAAVSWYAPGLEAGHFEQATRELALPRGVGLPGRAWESREEVWVPDVLMDSNFPRGPVAAQAGFRGAVAVPIVVAGEVVGVMDFFAREVRPPDRQLRELLAAVGSQIGEFVERVRAAEALRASEALKAAMLDSALDCVITMDHEGRVVELNPAAERTFGYRAEEVLGKEMAVLIVPPSLRERHRAALRRYVETEEPTILGRRIELTAMHADGREFPVELAISRIGDRSPPMFTGYVRDITERRRGQEEREELLRLEQLARLDASQARDQLEAIVSGVADAITAQDPDGGLVFANEAAVALLGYSSREELLAAFPHEITARFELFDEEGRPFPLERLPGPAALRGEGRGQTVVRFRDRATGDERWSAVKASPVLGPDGEVVMAINVMEDITAHKRAELREQFLSESSRVLGASLDPDETLGQVARLAVPEVADWCVVDLRGEAGGIERVALAHTDPVQVEKAEELQRRYPPDPRAETGVPQVIRTGQPEIYPEITEEMVRDGAEDGRHFELLRAFGLRSAMIVPIGGRERTLGAMTFVSGPSGRRFDNEDLELAVELARRCAAAIENARLYGERSYIARTLQESLLPSELPSIPGLETAARFHATGEGTEVGGDFYDLFQTGRRGWAVVVGDVCGKGPDAAAVTALARYTLRAAAMSERIPSRSLRVLNEALLRQGEGRRFCTVAYAYLEAEAEGTRIGLASGGHPLPLLLRHDGGVEELGAHGTLLGVVADPNLEDRAATLEAGDALVFYTDGVTEARGSGGVLGEERLAALVASCAGLPADAIAGRVEAAALAIQGGRPRDDIAVVVLRVTG